MNDNYLALPIMKRTKTPQWGLRYTHPTAKVRITLGPFRDFGSANKLLSQIEGVNKLVGKFTEFHFTPSWKGRRDLEYFEGEEDVRYLDIYVRKHVDASIHVTEERVPKHFVREDDGIWVQYGDLPEIINAAMTVRLSWEAAGDGKNGRYNPDNPGDEEYLRLFIDLWLDEKNRWIEADQHTTKIPVHTARDSLVKILKKVLSMSEKEILAGNRMKVSESLSPSSRGGSPR